MSVYVNLKNELTEITILLSKVLVPLRNHYHLILVLILNKIFINLETETDVKRSVIEEGNVIWDAITHLVAFILLYPQFLLCISDKKNDNIIYTRVVPLCMLLK